MLSLSVRLETVTPLLGRRNGPADGTMGDLNWGAAFDPAKWRIWP